MIEVPIKVLPNGKHLAVPSYRSREAAGLDLSAAIGSDVTVDLMPGDRVLVPCGIALELPSGYEGQIRPRSGLALKHGVTVLNAPGTVDSDYRGEIMVLLINLGDLPFAIHRGDRIAQLVIAPVIYVTLYESDDITKTQRGNGGFGSTGLGR